VCGGGTWECVEVGRLWVSASTASCRAVVMPPTLVPHNTHTILSSHDLGRVYKPLGER
jgi:hypothetical protein